MNQFIKRVDQSATLRAAFGTTNAAVGSVLFTDVLSDAPLGATATSNNGLADSLQAEPAKLVMTPVGAMYYHSAVYVRSTSYGAIPAATMTAAQFDALVNPRGIDIPVEFAARVGIAQQTQVAGGASDAFATGLLGAYNPLLCYRPSATSPGADRLAFAAGSGVRMLGLIALVLWALRLVRATVLPVIKSNVRGIFGAPAQPRIGAKAW